MGSMACDGNASVSGKETYSTLVSSQEVFRNLLNDPALPLPQCVRALYDCVMLKAEGGGEVAIPSPWRETEAISALKALEAALAISLGEIRYGIKQTAEIDIDHATIFLFMAYLSTIDGHSKFEPEAISRLPKTDIYRAMSNQYRRLSANMYKTSEDGVYYHLHGGLEATPILEMIGLPGYQDDLTDYNAICQIIQKQTMKFTPKELDAGTAARRQAGTIVHTQEQYLATAQGKIMSQKPLFEMKQLESSSPPAPFPQNDTASSSKPQLLAGIKVLDLTRVIAGPIISRTLAEYGATVLKITSPNLPDVPYYQVDGNFGKKTAPLDLRRAADRAVFEALLDDGVDVIIDGYRTGSLESLGYGVESLTKRFAGRSKGFIYVAENCFGFDGPLTQRTGWQPVADAACGMAWGQGQAMGLNEPVLPPFPMSDYGTGELGAIATLNALHHRATRGGSYYTTVSLTQYNLWVMSLKPYPAATWSAVRDAQDDAVKELGHLANVDHVAIATLASMRRLHPRLFTDRFMVEMYAEGFGGMVKTCKPVVTLSGTLNQWMRPTRPNGWDQPAWD